MCWPPAAGLPGHGDVAIVVLMSEAVTNIMRHTFARACRVEAIAELPAPGPLGAHPVTDALVPGRGAVP